KRVDGRGRAGGTPHPSPPPQGGRGLNEARDGNLSSPAPSTGAGGGGPQARFSAMNRWGRAAAGFACPGILRGTVMGFSSGLPLLLTLSTLSYWLAKHGVSKTSIGLFAAVGIPYSFKFLWAPLFDQIRPPFLGRRRGWAIIIQIALAIAILAMGF